MRNDKFTDFYRFPRQAKPTRGDHDRGRRQDLQRPSTRDTTSRFRACGAPRRSPGRSQS